MRHEQHGEQFALQRQQQQQQDDSIRLEWRHRSASTVAGRSRHVGHANHARDDNCSEQRRRRRRHGLVALVVHSFSNRPTATAAAAAASCQLHTLRALQQLCDGRQQYATTASTAAATSRRRCLEALLHAECSQRQPQPAAHDLRLFGRGRRSATAAPASHNHSHIKRSSQCEQRPRLLRDSVDAQQAALPAASAASALQFQLCRLRYATTTTAAAATAAFHAISPFSNQQQQHCEWQCGDEPRSAIQSAKLVRLAAHLVVGIVLCLIVAFQQQQQQRYPRNCDLSITHLNEKPVSHDPHFSYSCYLRCIHSGHFSFLFYIVKHTI